MRLDPSTTTPSDTSGRRRIDRGLPARAARRWSLVSRLGPAFVAAVAYIDPGNIATNTAAGSGHGFLLLWVVVLATLMAGPVQYLSAKLGIVSGKSLPQYVAGRTSRRARLAYWVQAELVAIATEVAEIIGAALALHLLFGIPLVPAGLVSAVLGLGLLLVRDALGPRAFEAICTLSLVAVGAGFAYGVVRSPPELGEMLAGLAPRLDGATTVLLATGIVGATVMPHAVYLHSALTAEQPLARGGYADRPDAEAPVSAAAGAAVAPTGAWTAMKDRLRWTRIDVTLAMIVAGGVNVSMLVLGATALRGSTDDSFAGIASALAERLGDGAGTAFLVALLVSGLASTAVGTSAGAAIMGGLLHRSIPLVVRRCVALVPALALLASGLDALSILVLSQVVLALGLPFALIPLVRATGDRQVMGGLTNGPVLRMVALTITVAILVLDLALVVLTLTGNG